MRFFFKVFPDISHISQNGLKKLFYNNKMPTSAELMEILKDNEIRGYSHYIKSKLINLLIKRGLIPEKYGTNKQKIAKKDIALKYNFLRQIRTNQRRLRYIIWEQIRLFFILLYTKLLRPCIKIPK